jgi:thiamine biosynthesis protein ThiS
MQLPADRYRRYPGTIMRVTINGEHRDIMTGVSVDDLLRTLGIDARKVAVERNLEIVPKSRFGATHIDDGDRLEIVHFIGGG